MMPVAGTVPDKMRNDSPAGKVPERVSVGFGVPLATMDTASNTSWEKVLDATDRKSVV